LNSCSHYQKIYKFKSIGFRLECNCIEITIPFILNFILEVI
jgi:hypothetical protein